MVGVGGRLGGPHYPILFGTYLISYLWLRIPMRLSAGSRCFGRTEVGVSAVGNCVVRAVWPVGVYIWGGYPRDPVSCRL